jgi:ABC-type glycerol-3-phosphate transport system substrate-binding protein
MIAQGKLVPALARFAIVLLLGIGLACGGGQGDRTENGKAVIHFWQFWTEPAVRAVITKAVTEFEQENPEYKVEVTDLTWNDGHQKIVAAFAGGQVPDLLELGSDWIAEFANAGALTDLSSEYVRSSDGYVGWPSAMYQDRCWALPWYLSTRVLYQNDTLAWYLALQPDRPPVIWDELLEWSAKANRRKPTYFGYGVNSAERHRLYKKFLPYLWSTGGDILSEDGTHCILDSEEGERALQFLVRLSKNGIMEKQAVLDELFISGRLLYHLSGDWLHRRLKDMDLQFGYSVHMIPSPGPGDGQPISFAGGEYLTIPRRAKEPLGAIKLARHLLRTKNIFNLCIATDCPTPVSIEVGNNPYFLEDPIRRMFLQQLVSSKSPPVHPKWVEIEAEIEWGVEQALYEKLPVTAALVQTCERIDKILAPENSP